MFWGEIKTSILESANQQPLKGHAKVSGPEIRSGFGGREGHKQSRSAAQSPNAEELVGRKSGQANASAAQIQISLRLITDNEKKMRPRSKIIVSMPIIIVCSKVPLMESENRTSQSRFGTRKFSRISCGIVHYFENEYKH